MRGRLGSAARAGLVLLVLSLALAACDSGSTSRSEGTRSSSGPAGSASPSDTCSDVPKLVVTAVQHYVDAYGATVSSGGSSSASQKAPGDTELRNALSQTRDELVRRRCDTSAYRQALQQQLAGVTARGPLARAVFLRLQASLSGTIRADVATVDAKPGDDLATVLAGLAAGSTVRLAPGTYRLDQTLVLLQGVTLRGSGRGRTTIRSSSDQVGVLVLTDGRVELSGLTLSHAGKAAASGLIGGPTSSVVLARVRVTGAVGGSSGKAGGAGVLMSGQAGAEAGRGTTLQVTGSRFDHNSGAGVLLTGQHRASIRGSQFTANGQCGVCFTASSTGAVRRSSFVGNSAGVAVLDGAVPLLQDLQVSGGLVGVQVGGHGRPVLRDVRISGARRAALIYTDTSSGRIQGVHCSQVKVGLVVGPRSLPYVGSTNCPVARSK